MGHVELSTEQKSVAHPEGAGERVVERDHRVVLVEERPLPVGVVLRDEVVQEAVVEVVVHRAQLWFTPKQYSVSAWGTTMPPWPSGFDHPGGGPSSWVAAGEARARAASLPASGPAAGEVKSPAVIALRHEPAEVVIEGAVLLDDDHDVVDGDVGADRVVGADRLRGPRPGLNAHAARCGASMASVSVRVMGGGASTSPLASPFPPVPPSGPPASADGTRLP